MELAFPADGCEASTVYTLVQGEASHGRLIYLASYTSYTGVIQSALQMRKYKDNSVSDYRNKVE